MDTPSTARYAIYYAPEPGGPLDIFGQTWFDPKAAAKLLAGIGLDPSRVAAPSESARR